MRTAAGPGEASFTSLGVRLRPVRRCAGQPGSTYDWLLFPGGPGRGSESLVGLARTADLPGTTWLVDLPGDGSNVDAPGAPADPYPLWPQVLLEAVDAVPSPVAVGHSTGGAHLLCVPELETRLAGLVLISAAPDRGWVPAFEAARATHPVPEATLAAATYEACASAENLRQLALASAPWAFTATGLDAGRSLLARLPYNPSALGWSADHFERQYVSRWWPTTLPTLIVSGAEDRLVDQSLWDDPYYRGHHVRHTIICAAGHFPWVEQPGAVRAALQRLATGLPNSLPHGHRS